MFRISIRFATPSAADYTASGSGIRRPIVLDVLLFDRISALNLAKNARLSRGFNARGDCRAAFGTAL